MQAIFIGLFTGILIVAYVAVIVFDSKEHKKNKRK